ncbi:MAG TPA: restriction endonuclease subunit S, partial [bacterium]|nr:restriction endonuclease subunit S [bacterium]
RFLYYLFNSHPVRQQIRASCSGVKVRHTSPSRIYDVKVDIPPLPTQRKIAAILSAYDDMIENNLRRIKILEEMAQNLYREWFVKFRFPGYRYARFVDSPLGRIPEGWEVRGAMENNHWSFIHQNIGAYEGVKRYYATADIDGITITSNGIEYTYSQKPSRAQKQPLINSVWFARMQETYKMIAVAKPNAFLAANCMLSSGFAGFKAHDEDSFAFLFLTIKSKEFHLEKDRYCTGATQRSLTNDGLSRILTISPPRDIVQNFGRLAMRHVELILVLQQRNKILRRTRDLLLPKLISGEVDVSELDITVPEEVAT